GAAQLVQRLDADRVSVPCLAMHEHAGGVGTRCIEADVDRAVGSVVGEAGPEAELLEVGAAQLFHAPPLEVHQELAGPSAAVEPLELRRLAGRALRCAAAEERDDGCPYARGESERQPDALHQPCYTL